VRTVDGGVIVVDGLDDLAAAAARRIADVERFDPGVRRLVNPHEYHVSVTDAVFDLKRRLLTGF
jgi:nicotinate phosphoribosyltransferase